MEALRKTIGRHPLAVLALVALVGIVAADQAEQRDGWLLAGTATAALVCAAWALWRPGLLALFGLVGCGFAWVHQLRLAETRWHPLHGLLAGGASRIDFEATGRFLRAPMLTDTSGAEASREAVFLAESIELPSRGQRVLGPTQLELWLELPDFVPRDGRYRIMGTLSRLKHPRNPGGYNSALASERQGMVAQAVLRSAALLEPEALGLRLRLLGLAERCREWIAREVTRGLEADPDPVPAALITSMALGVTEGASAEMQEPFRDSGTLHIFAVSGLHVGLLAIIGWMFLQPLGLSRGRSLALLIPLMVGYAFITGWRPSAQRSAVMTSLMLLAPVLLRQSRLINGLGAAALLLWALDTLPAFQAGFQLSFGVLWAMAAGARWFERPLLRWSGEPERPAPPSTAERWSRRLLGKLKRGLLIALASSIAAWLGSVLLMSWHFQTISPVAVVANLLLVPLAFLSLFLVALSLLAAGLHCPAAQVCLNHANWAVAKGMMLSASFFADLPGAHFPAPIKELRAAPPVALSVLSLPWGESAQLLSTDDGQAWLLDTASSESFARALMPYLKNQALSRLDGVILSHSDIEHIGALPQVLRRYRPQRLAMPFSEPWPHELPETSLRSFFEIPGAPTFQPLRVGDELRFGSVTLHVLYPGPSDLHDRADDRALVARLDYGPHRLLWCSDAGFIAEKTLLARCDPAELRCDVVVRNQHASDYSCLDEFLLAVAPQALITSNFGQTGEHRLPERVRLHCRQRGIALLDLSITGLVRVEAWPTHLQLHSHLTGETLVLRRSP